MSEYKGGGLIYLPNSPEDWELGAVANKPVLFPDGDHSKYLSRGQHQYTNSFDPWCCTNISEACALEICFNRLMEIDSTVRPILEKLGFLDDQGKCQVSHRALAVMSGTKPGVGNSFKAGLEVIRKIGFVPDKMCPSFDTMSEQEYFTISKEVENFAGEILKYFDINYESLKVGYATGCVENHADLKEARKYGGLIGAVGSPYNYENGVVVGSVGDKGSVHGYNHAIDVNNEINPNDLIRDSYEPFDKKFACYYGVGTPKLITVTPKKKFQLVKEVGKPMFYIMCNVSGNLYRVNDGKEIPGGDIVKTLTGGVYSKPLELPSIDQSKVKDLISNL